MTSVRTFIIHNYARSYTFLLSINPVTYNLTIISRDTHTRCTRIIKINITKVIAIDCCHR